MTYRERREARAERLRGWAEKREATARALYSRGDPYRGDIAFNTQPGHIPERARVIAATERAFENWSTAERMNDRADSIERATAHAIYNDDPDATERLAEKLAALEAERARQVTINAAIRKAVRGTSTHAERRPILAELARAGVMTAEDLADLESSARAFGSYFDRRPVTFSTDNLSGQITKLRQRIAALSAPHRTRLILARYAGTCATCGDPTAPGAVIAEAAPREWSHQRCVA